MIGTVILLVILVAVALLAPRYGTDSRDREADGFFAASRERH